MRQPIGLWPTCLIFDLIFIVTGNPVFASASFLCMGAGIIGALGTIPIDFAKLRKKTMGIIYITLNLLATLLMVVNFFARYGLTNGIPYHVTIGEFVLSLVSVTLAGMATYLFTAGQKSEKKPTHLKQAA